MIKPAIGNQTHRIPVTLAVLALVALISPSMASADLATIRARGKLIVAMKNPGAPAADAHRDPAHFQKRNFELEIARRIAGRILGDEKKLEVVTLPGSQRLPALETDTVDVVIAMIRVDERARTLADLSDPYFEGGFALLLSAHSRIAKLDDLSGKRVALPHQKHNDPRARVDSVLTERQLRPTVVSYPNFRVATQALVAHRVDALISYNPNIEAYLATAPAGVHKYPELLTHDSYAVAVKKGDTELLQVINEVIRSAKNTGELQTLAHKWGLALPDSP